MGRANRDDGTISPCERYVSVRLLGWYIRDNGAQAGWDICRRRSQSSLHRLDITMVASDRRCDSTYLPLNDWINFAGVAIVHRVGKPCDLLGTVWCLREDCDG